MQIGSSVRHLHKPAEHCAELHQMPGSTKGKRLTVKLIGIMTLSSEEQPKLLSFLVKETCQTFSPSPLISPNQVR